VKLAQEKVLKVLLDGGYSKDKTYKMIMALSVASCPPAPIGLARGQCERKTSNA
jgi:hypothetical protein